MQVFSNKDSSLVQASTAMEVTVHREPFDWTPQEMEGFNPVAFQTVQKELPPLEPWEPERWELLRPDERQQMKPAGSHRREPYGAEYPDRFSNPADNHRFPPPAVRRTALLNRSLRSSIPSPGTARMGKPSSCPMGRPDVSPSSAFSTVCGKGRSTRSSPRASKTYAAFGPAELDAVRYQQFPETESPDLSEPLLREIAALPEGMEFSINAYLPAKAARENPHPPADRRALRDPRPLRDAEGRAGLDYQNHGETGPV